RVSQPIELVASLDGSAKSQELSDLLSEIASVCDKIRVDAAGTGAGTPSFQIRRAGSDVGVTFAGIPLGHEFTSLVLALLQVGGHPPKVAPEVLEQVRGLDGDY